MRRSIAACLVGVLMLPRLVSGQTLTPGSRVRFTHPGEGTRAGTLVALTADTLVVRLPDRAAPARLPLDQVTRLDVSRGRQRHLQYAVLGAAVGAGVGVAGGLAMESESDMAYGGALLGGIMCGAIGGVLGLTAGVIPSENWERVPVERGRISVGASPTGRGARVGLSLAF